MTDLALIRIYANMRSAILERLVGMEPAVVLYHRTRYDFDASLVPPGYDLRQVTRRAALLELARRHYDVIEVNEPLTSNRWLDVLAQILVVRGRGMLTRRRGRLVAYCIGNADPALEFARRWRLPGWLARPVARLFVRALTRGLDRLAFGTAGSLEMYERYVGRGRLSGRARLMEALPAPCQCLDDAGRAQSRSDVVFVGAFEEHKGIRVLLDAWDVVQNEHPGARLRLIGKGRLVEEVQRWAETHSAAQVVIDPPRSEIHAMLRQAHVLVLASQPRGPWREQIGLPILEGLAHGCEVVTTSETGLSDWLQAHSHNVIATADSSSELAAALSAAIVARRRPSDILDQLPLDDQRLAADRWLMSDV